MMRTRALSKGFALLLALSFLLPLACREEKETIEKYGKGMIAAPERAKVTVDLTKIRPSLEIYRIDHDGEYPASLKDLNLELYYPDEYSYDSKTGKVKSKHYPML